LKAKEPIEVGTQNSYLFMHTLLIHQSFVGPNDAGGTRHYELARRIVERGENFTIVASDVSYLTGEKTESVNEENYDGVRVLRAYTYPALHRSFAGRLISFFSFSVTSFFVALFRAGKVDVVMGTSPPIFQSLSAWMIAALRRRPFVLEIRDLWPEFIIDMGLLKNPLAIRLSRFLENFLYARADFLLVNSPAYVDYLIEKGVTKERITFIPNGVDVSMFDPTADGKEIREKFGLKEKFVIVYAGAIGVANNLDLLIDAAKELQNNSEACFLIVGDGKERVRLQARAEELNLKNVIFTGAQPKSEMPKFLACADACVAVLQDIKMFRTTYPNKVFDYMAAGRPVLLAIDGVIREVVESAQGGIFISASDAKELSDAILHLSADRMGAKEMGRRGRDYVGKNFNREEQSKQFANFLKKTVKEI